MPLSLDSTADGFTGTAYVKIIRKTVVVVGECCGDDHMIIDFGGTTWKMLLNVFGPGRGEDNGKVEVGSDQVNPKWLVGPTLVDDDSWHHLAYTYDGKTKVLYIDGQVDIDVATSGTPSVSGYLIFP